MRPAGLRSTAAVAPGASSCVLLVAGAAGYGFWISGEEGLYGQTKRGLEALAIAAGFGVKRITVEGQQHATDAELTRRWAPVPEVSCSPSTPTPPRSGSSRCRG